MRYLGSHHPELMDAYAELYRNGSVSLLRRRPGSPIIGAAAQARS